MRNRWLVSYSCFLSMIIFSTFMMSISATTQWSRMYQIGSDAHIRSVTKTNDGGYLLGGHTKPNGRSDSQALLVKTDSSGNIKWNVTYGGSFTDEVHSVVASNDGGYVAAGVTWPSSTLGLLWVFKVNSSGELQWDMTYGGTYNENGWSIIKTNPSGFAVVGFSNNFGLGDSDFWLIKINDSGGKEWDKSYGTTGNDIAYSIIQTSDGGYAFVGRQNNRQCLLVKTDSSGAMQWNQTYSDPQVGSAGQSLIQTSDYGYAIAGYLESGTSSDPALSRDFWLVKTDSTGVEQWNRTYGGSSEEIARSVVQLGDGGYALAGYSESYGVGTQDLWMVITDGQGNPLSTQTFGGVNTDTANSMILTSDGGLLLGGNTESFDFDSAALLIIKTDSGGLSPDPLNSSWSPPPENVVFSTVAATVFTGGASIVIAATFLSPGLPADSFLQRIRDLLPDSLKQWLESFMSSKMKMAVEEKKSSPYLPTKEEVLVYIVTVLVTGFSFSYVKVDSFSQILTVLPIILSTTILVGFLKTVILTSYSRVRGVWAEYKFWYFGLATFLATTLIFKVPFSSPSRIVHHEGKSTERLSAILAAGEIVIGLIFAAGFYILLIKGYSVVGSVGLAMCIIGAFFDTLPISPMNGNSIYRYNKVAWVAMFIVTLSTYIFWLFLN